VIRKQKLTPQQALQKAKHYCAYQERSHFEVKQKLYALGLNTSDVEQALALLIEENYLNEERFAIGFAGGKFRMKQWGKMKIEYELKLKKVGAYNIKKALQTIDEVEYGKTLLQLAKQKWDALKTEQYINRLAKTNSYLIQRGYETSLISNAIAVIRSENKTN
jgi:regulatory protein